MYFFAGLSDYDVGIRRINVGRGKIGRRDNFYEEIDVKRGISTTRRLWAIRIRLEQGSRLHLFGIVRQGRSRWLGATYGRSSGDVSVMTTATEHTVEREPIIEG